MKKITLTLVTLQLVISLQVFSQHGEMIKQGMTAPDFSGKNQDGQTISLKQYKGKKVVLYFYPKDNTAGCTAEACSLRDNYDSLTKVGYVVLGVSTDNEVSHLDFKAKYNLPFNLIADVDTSITKQYGVWVEKERDGQKFWGMARTTFIIDEKGLVSDRIDKVDTKNHAQQVLSIPVH